MRFLKTLGSFQDYTAVPQKPFSHEPSTLADVFRVGAFRRPAFRTIEDDDRRADWITLVATDPLFPAARRASERDDSRWIEAANIVDHHFDGAAWHSAFPFS